jgi:hypothetical protein
MSNLREFIEQSKEQEATWGRYLPRSLPPAQKSNPNRNIDKDMYVHTPAQDTIVSTEQSELTTLPDPSINPDLVQVVGRRGVDYFGDRIYSHPRYPGKPVDLPAPEPLPRAFPVKKTLDDAVNAQRREIQIQDAHLLSIADKGTKTPQPAPRTIPVKKSYDEVMNAQRKESQMQDVYANSLINTGGQTPQPQSRYAPTQLRQKPGRMVMTKNDTTHDQLLVRDFNLDQRPHQDIVYRNVGYLPVEEKQPIVRNLRMEKINEQQVKREQQVRERKHEMDKIYSKIVTLKDQ